MYDLRQKVAKNAGFANYRDFAHREKNRFDYTPADCMRFHVAVEEAILTAIERINDRLDRRIGLHPLRPWHLTADLLCPPPLKPFIDIREVNDRGVHVFPLLDVDLL